MHASSKQERFAFSSSAFYNGKQIPQMKGVVLIFLFDSSGTNQALKHINLTRSITRLRVEKKLEFTFKPSKKQ